MPDDFEVYVETFTVDQWRDECVYRTTSTGTGWVAKPAVDANRPRETGVIYAAASDDFACTHMTIRRAAPAS